MKQIVQFIEDNNISEEEVAKAAHMSLRNFRRQIHSEDRTQTRIVLILADYNHQSIDSIFFDQMYNQPINLEGLTWNQVQDIMKLIHPELFTDIKRTFTGHLLGAAGAVEAIATIEAIRHSYVPKTAGTKELSDYIEANVVYGEGQEADIEYAISNTFGFGGHNAVLAFKRWEA